MIVFAPYLLTATKKAKQDAWETIRPQLNSVGANIDSAKTLRDVSNIRRSTLELDEIVLDILDARVLT